jgi:hypothetical protein
MGVAYDKINSSGSNIANSDSEISEPKILRTFTIVVLTIYIFVFLMAILSGANSIEDTRGVVSVLNAVLFFVFQVITLFLFIKRNQLYLLFVLIMSIGGYLSILAYRLLFVTGMKLDITDFYNILFYGFPLILIFLYHRKRTEKSLISPTKTKISDR